METHPDGNLTITPALGVLTSVWFNYRSDSDK